MEARKNNSQLRILIFRPDNIGDFVLFSGALRCFRDLYHTADITLAVQDHLLNFVEYCPYVDRVVAVDSLCKIRDYNVIGARFVVPALRRIAGLLSTNFDKVFYPVKSPTAHHLRMLESLRARDISGVVGCDLNLLKAATPYTKNLKFVFNHYLDVSDVDPWQHELITTMNYLNHIGCKVDSVDDIRPEFWIPDDEYNPVRHFMKDVRTLIGLFPGASSEKRCWSAEHYAEFAESLGGQLDFVVYGSASDKGICSEVASRVDAVSNGQVLNLAGKTTLRGLVKSIQSCDLFVGTETSGLHIAIACELPTIGIVGGGHYDRFVPWGDPERNLFLTKRMECFHCDWKCQYDEIRCIEEVGAEQVAAAAISLLQLDLNDS